MKKSLLYPVKILVAVLFNVVLLFGFLKEAYARDTIIWAKDILPPSVILEGPDKDRGILDGMYREYEKALPEFDHEQVVANMARILFMMKEGQNKCYGGFIKTPEREKFIQFTIPNALIMANAIVTTKEKQLSLFHGRDTVSFDETLNTNNLKLGITKDRAYGSPIDEIVNSHKKDNVFYRSGKTSLQGLLKMLAKNRIDFSIGFPYEISYIARQMDEKDTFSVIAIEEFKSRQWIKIYAGCPRTPWGKRTVKRLNQALIEIRPMREYMNHILKWHPENIHNSLKEAYQNQILSIIE